MFNEALSYLGGLLGFGGGGSQIPAEYYASGPVAPMAANEQGPAIPPPPGGVADRRDPFAQYTPEQRRQLWMAYLTDTLAQVSGREGTAAQSLMRAFNTRAGGGPVVPQMQAPQAMQPAPMVQLQAPTMRMPQMQIGVQRPGVSSYLLRA